MSDKHGNTRLPSRMGVVMSGVVAVFGLFWTIVAGAMFPPMALFGILFIGVAIYGGVATSRKLQAYEEALSRYQEQKRKLISSHADDRQSD